LASTNPGKVAEIRTILGPSLELVPRPHDVPDVAEDAATFVGNARLKAAAVGAVTGQAALADDSGLEVDALDGAPGVRSARYAGEGATDEANVAKVLRALTGRVDPAERTARFRCAVVLRWPDGTEVVGEGSVAGHLADAPRGSGGFGYDPIFVPRGGPGLTFGELPPEVKQTSSHRSLALAALLARL
jgi:XTP/dITP diphosphohydrolase